MPQTQPPQIDPVPTPPIQRGDRATFSSRVDAFIMWLVNAVTQFRALATNVYNNAVDAFQSATLASTKASNATDSATAAGTSASNAASSASAAATSASNAASSATDSANSALASANSAAGLTATSNSTNSLGLGNKTFNVQPGKQFAPNIMLQAVSLTDSSKYIFGSVVSYSGSTLVINSVSFGGTGSVSGWSISVSGVPGAQGATGGVNGGTLTGALNEAKSSDVASSSNINLNTATGNLVHVTGSTTISSITLQSGAERSVIFDGNPSIINGQSLSLPGGANISVRAGDRALFRGDSNGTVLTHFQRLDGTALVSSPSIYTLISETNVSSSVASIDFTNQFNSTFDRYVLEIQDMLVPSGNPMLQMRLFTDSGIDSAANYREALGTSNNNPLSMINVSQLAMDAGQTLSFTTNIRAANSSNTKSVGFHGAFISSASVYVLAREVIYTNTLPVRGFRLFLSNGALFTSGNIRIYGIRKQQG